MLESTTCNGNEISLPRSSGGSLDRKLPDHCSTQLETSSQFIDECIERWLEKEKNEGIRTFSNYLQLSLNEEKPPTSKEATRKENVRFSSSKDKWKEAEKRRRERHKNGYQTTAEFMSTHPATQKRASERSLSQLRSAHGA